MSSVASNWKGKMYLQSKWLRAIYKDILITSHFVSSDHQENKVAAPVSQPNEASTQSKDKHQTHREWASRICSISFNMRAFSASNLEISWRSRGFLWCWAPSILGSLKWFLSCSRYDPHFVEVLVGRFEKLNTMNPNPKPTPPLMQWHSVLCTTALLLPHGWENLQLSFRHSSTGIWS